MKKHKIDPPNNINHGWKPDPKTKRPPKPPSQHVSDNEMISKYEYVMKRIMCSLNNYKYNKDKVDPELFKSLIEQWEFDYEMELSHRPWVLKKGK
ncbi:hypothetical protein [Halalkalibacter oceani]|uniref:hypothetical protein n=1 Tax=Halalkalibacter oceani TaxID=1653776 RepID=UPI00339AC1BB